VNARHKARHDEAQFSGVENDIERRSQTRQMRGCSTLLLVFAVGARGGRSSARPGCARVNAAGNGTLSSAAFSSAP